MLLSKADQMGKQKIKPKIRHTGSYVVKIFKIRIAHSRHVIGNAKTT